MSRIRLDDNVLRLLKELWEAEKPIREIIVTVHERHGVSLAPGRVSYICRSRWGGRYYTQRSGLERRGERTKLPPPAERRRGERRRAPSSGTVACEACRGRFEVLVDVAQACPHCGELRKPFHAGDRGAA